MELASNRPIYKALGHTITGIINVNKRVYGLNQCNKTKTICQPSAFNKSFYLKQVNLSLPLCCTTTLSEFITKKAKLL